MVSLICKKLLACLLLISLSSFPGLAYAVDQINITISEDMNEVIFDGRWTHYTEWKRSSWDRFIYNDQDTIHLRSAHQDNFIYFLIDFQTDESPDSSKDKAMICLDTNNDKTEIPNSDDYCFLTLLDENSSQIKQGTGNPETVFREIEKPKEFIAIGSPSDANDRYSNVPHSSYEFRIPTELVGRNNIYGIYIAVYDEKNNSIYTWPYEAKTESPFEKPNPRLWGELVSPDKSLPEFQLPILVLLPLFISAIYFVKRFNSKNEQ